MDRDAAETVLSGLARTAAEMQSLSSELASWIEGRQGDLPDEEDRLRSRALELRNEVGLELERVRDAVRQAVSTPASPIAELHEEIEKAGREMRDWLTGGLGMGSKQKWLETFRAAESVRMATAGNSTSGITVRVNKWSRCSAGLTRPWRAR